MKKERRKKNKSEQNNEIQINYYNAMNEKCDAQTFRSDNNTKKEKEM